MKLKHIILPLIFIFLSGLSIAQGIECVPSGKLVTLKGPPGQEKPVVSCCAKLKTIAHPEDAMQGAAPGRIVCAPCGNRKCDRQSENKFNCPQDCK